VFGIAELAHPEEVFFCVIAAARSELDVMNMAAGPKLADLAGLSEHPKAEAFDRRRVYKSLRRPRVYGHSAGSPAARPVGQNTQEDALPEHAATPHV
jgi:hypothetical protein